ncbi:MAG: fimbrillin family protein [Tannerellaceae bacterium]
MKLKIQISLAMASLFTLWGCTTDENLPSEKDAGKVEVNIHAGIETRAINKLWENEDVIGVTMFKKGTSQLAEGNYANCKYTTAAGLVGSFSPTAQAQTIYFPKDGSEVDFMAYYPQREGMKADYKMPLTVADQTTSSKIDFMTAEHLEGFSKETPHVRLRFYHRLSKMIFQLKTEGNITPERLKGAEVSLIGMNTKGEYNLLTNQLTPELSARPILVPMNLETGATGQAIVLPRKAARGVDLQIKLKDGGSYTAHMSDTLNLRAGYQYTFKLTLKKTEMTITADIQDWTDAGTIDKEADAIRIIGGTTDKYFKTGDEMTLFATTNITQGIDLGAYAYNASNQTWTSTPPDFWENIDGTGSVTFRASHLVAPAPDKSNQLPDMLLAEVKDVARYKAITLPFVHAYSLLIVKLIAPAGGYTEAELAQATITLPNYLTGATVGQAVYKPGTDRKDIQLSKVAGEVSWKGCIQPQTIAPKTPYIIVGLNKNQYKVSTGANEAQAFVANKKLTIIITLKKTELTGISATYTDWGLLPDINVDTDLDKE